MSSAGHETVQEGPVFTGDTLAALQRKFAEYPTKQALLLPALWMVQEKRGWISEQSIGEVAELLGLTPAYVKGVVTFYTMYHTHPVGRHFIQVCTTSPCGLCGAEDTMRALLQDKALYESMNTTVSEMRALLSDIRKDPKKYLNVRVSIF